MMPRFAALALPTARLVVAVPALLASATAHAQSAAGTGPASPPETTPARAVEAAPPRVAAAPEEPSPAGEVPSGPATPVVSTGADAQAAPVGVAATAATAEPMPTTFRVLIGFPVFPIGVGIEQQFGPRVSAGLDGTANFVVVFHAHMRVYANPTDRARLFVQPGVTHLQNAATSSTSDIAELRVGVDVRVGASTSFAIDLGAGRSTGGFASGVVPALAIAWGTVFGR
jgi:hypothetical protein